MSNLAGPTSPRPAVMQAAAQIPAADSWRGHSLDQWVKGAPPELEGRQKLAALIRADEWNTRTPQFLRLPDITRLPPGFSNDNVVYLDAPQLQELPEDMTVATLNLSQTGPLVVSASCRFNDLSLSQTGKITLSDGLGLKSLSLVSCDWPVLACDLRETTLTISAMHQIGDRLVKLNPRALDLQYCEGVIELPAVLPGNLDARDCPGLLVDNLTCGGDIQVRGPLDRMANVTAAGSISITGSEVITELCPNVRAAKELSVCSCISLERIMPGVWAGEKVRLTACWSLTGLADDWTGWQPGVPYGQYETGISAKTANGLTAYDPSWTVTLEGQDDETDKYNLEYDTENLWEESRMRELYNRPGELQQHEMSVFVNFLGVKFREHPQPLRTLWTTQLGALVEFALTGREARRPFLAAVREELEDYSDDPCDGLHRIQVAMHRAKVAALPEAERSQAQAQLENDLERLETLRAKARAAAQEHHRLVDPEEIVAGYVGQLADSLRLPMWGAERFASPWVTPEELTAAGVESPTP